MTAKPARPSLESLGSESFVSLTTFRRNGERVATPVWIARDGDALIVTTPAGSGKVKRLRHDPRVLLQPCGRRGALVEGSTEVAGTAAILDAEGNVRDLTRAFVTKYKFEYRVIMLVEGVVARGSRRRVILRITL